MLYRKIGALNKSAIKSIKCSVRTMCKLSICLRQAGTGRHYVSRLFLIVSEVRPSRFFGKGDYAIAFVGHAVADGWFHLHAPLS